MGVGSRRLRRGQLGHCRLLRVGLLRRLERRCPVGEQPRRLDPHGHVGQLELDRLDGREEEARGATRVAGVGGRCRGAGTRQPRGGGRIRAAVACEWVGREWQACSFEMGESKALRLCAYSIAHSSEAWAMPSACGTVARGGRTSTVGQRHWRLPTLLPAAPPLRRRTTRAACPTPPPSASLPGRRSQCGRRPASSCRP